MKTFLFTKHCEKEVNISISYKNQVTGQFHGENTILPQENAALKLIL